MTQQPPVLPPPPQYRPQPPFNTYAIIAIILATVVLPPLGIYFGHQAKKQIAVTGERGMELAQASIVVGWVLTGLMALSLLAFCAFFVIWLGFMGAIFSAGTTQP